VKTTIGWVDTFTADMDGQLYRARFTNSAGSTVTQSAVLHIHSPYQLTSPASTLALEGENASFSTTQSGWDDWDITTSIQWWTADPGSNTFTAIYGATGPSLVVPNVTAADDGRRYRATLSATEDGVTTTVATSVDATLTVSLAPATPGRGTSESPLEVDAGGSLEVDLLVGASGDTLTVAGFGQGTHGSVAAGPTSNVVTYTSDGTPGPDSFSYVLADRFGRVAAGLVRLSATSPPVVSVEPESVSVSEGSSAQFVTKAVGATSAQWEVSSDGGASWDDMEGETWLDANG
jgi:hypothetical protein